MKNYLNDQIINVGISEKVTIKELAEMVIKVVDVNGKLDFDSTKSDGSSEILPKESVRFLSNQGQLNGKLVSNFYFDLK